MDQGIVALMMLNMLCHLDITKIHPNGFRVHLEAEVTKLFSS